MKYLSRLYWLTLSVFFVSASFAQTTSWLASADPVSVERGTKATFKVAAKTTAVEAANLFVVAKAVGASVSIDLTPVLSLKDDTLELDLGLISVPAGKYAIEISHIDAGGSIQELARTVLMVTAPGGASHTTAGPAERRQD